MTDTLERPEAEAAPPRPRRRGRRIRSVLFGMIVVIAAFVATGVLPVREYLERSTAVDAARAELEQLQSDNQVLADDIEAMYTDDEVERLAREQYGFVREGEIGYMVLPGEAPSEGTEGTQGDESAEPVPPVREDRSFLERIWDFITGNDQVDDG